MMQHTMYFIHDNPMQVGLWINQHGLGNHQLLIQPMVKYIVGMNQLPLGLKLLHLKE